MSDQQEDTEVKEVNVIAEETFVHDIMEQVLTEFKAMPEPWQKLSKKDQDMVISRMECMAKTVGKSAIRTILAQGESVVRVTLDKVVIADKQIQGAISMARKSAERDGLYEMQGSTVTLVLSDAESLTDNGHGHKSEDEQKSLDIPPPEPKPEEKVAAESGSENTESENPAPDEPEVEDHGDEFDDEGFE